MSAIPPAPDDAGELPPVWRSIFDLRQTVAENRRDIAALQDGAARLYALVDEVRGKVEGGLDRVGDKVEALRAEVTTRMQAMQTESLSAWPPEAARAVAAAKEQAGTTRALVIGLLAALLGACGVIAALATHLL